MADKLPAMMFYTGDWLKDPKVSRLKPSTRGIWFDLICAMHEDEMRGEIIGSVEDLARVCRSTFSELRVAVDELREYNTADVTECNGKIRICNRRMYRSYLVRKSNRERVQHHRVRKRNAKCNGDVTPLLSISVSDSKSKTTPPTPPAGGSVASRFERFMAAWNKLPEKFPKCMKATPKRLKSFGQRIKDSDWPKMAEKALAAISNGSSDFLSGKGNRGWLPDIDWFLRPDTVIKIVEGKYDGKIKTDSKRPQATSEQGWDESEKKLREQGLLLED